MVINIKKLEDILNDKISLIERGILITILLLKDKDSDITLMKCKKKINFLQSKQELVNLHELGFIQWSGYTTAVKYFEQKKTKPEVEKIFNFMNGLYGGRGFKLTVERITQINSLLKEYSTAEILLVISNRYYVWKDEPTMCKHLVPETIFRKSKFLKYLEEAKYTKEGESFVSAESINLKQGEEITSEIAKNFSDNDTYTVMSYELDSKGIKVTKGREITKYGKDIKRLLKVRDNQDWKDFILTYIQK